jgi:hypothetical protein
MLSQHTDPFLPQRIEHDRIKLLQPEPNMLSRTRPAGGRRCIACKTRRAIVTQLPLAGQGSRGEWNGQTVWRWWTGC